MTEEYFVYDPRKAIMSPFTTCPFCGGQEYGLLMVSNHGYVKRCRDCMKDERFPLPQLEKKVLYLDQFAVSGLMKVVHPDHRERIARRGDDEERFWLALFDRLEYLVKLHVLVCPWSEAHWEESYVYAAFEAVRRIYEHFSGDVRFEDPGSVKNRQVIDAFKRWLGCDPERPLTRRQVLRGNLDGWNNKFSVHARLELDPDTGEELKAKRQKLHDGMKSAVDSWRTSPRRDFGEYFAAEVAAYGPSHLRSYGQRLKQVVEVFEGGGDPSTLLDHTNSQILIYTMTQLLEEEGVARADVFARVKEFFASNAVAEIPSVRIACGLFAAMAVRASLDQAPVPNQGMVTDVNIVSTYLPYCDAMVVDKECYELIDFANERLHFADEVAVLTLGDRNGLLAWLDEVAAEVPDAHRQLIGQIYGPSWLKPYREIFAGRS